MCVEDKPTCTMEVEYLGHNLVGCNPHSGGSSRGFHIVCAYMGLAFIGKYIEFAKICNTHYFIAGVIGSDVPWLECPACNTLTWAITVTE